MPPIRDPARAYGNNVGRRISPLLEEVLAAIGAYIGQLHVRIHPTDRIKGGLELGLVSDRRGGALIVVIRERLAGHGLLRARGLHVTSRPPRTRTAAKPHRADRVWPASACVPRIWMRPLPVRSSKEGLSS